MKADTVFVGVRDKDQTAIFLMNSNRCLPLLDYLAHCQELQGCHFEWGEDSVGARLTAIALLTAATGRPGLGVGIMEDFLADVISQLEREGFELVAGAVQQYVELWVTCRARQMAKQKPCYGCGDG